MAAIQTAMTKAGEEAKKVMGMLAANYVKGAVVGVIMPMLTDALKEGLEDAKEEAKGESKEEVVGRRALEDRLPFDEKEAQKDTVILHLDSCPEQRPWFGAPWTGYEMYTVKYGSDAKDGNRFYSVGYRVILRHMNLQQLDEGVRKEFKDVKEAPAIPALPADALHGMKCLCIRRTVDAGSQLAIMRPYVDAFKQKPYCHSLYSAKLFRIGEDYKAQALLKEVFDQAVVDTAFDYLGRQPCKWCEFRDPFDEAEAIRQLLYMCLSGPVLSDLRNAAHTPVCSYNAQLAAENGLVTALNTAAAGWGAAQDGINEIKSKALKAVSDAGATLVEALKPHLLKVLEKINSKMKKKEEEKKEEKKKAKIGDLSYVWKLERTPVGARLHAAMGSGPAKAAIQAAESDLNPRTIVEAELRGVAEAIGGDGAADIPGVGGAIRDLSSNIHHQINRFNTLAPLLEAAESLAAVRDDEKVLTAAAGNPEAIAKAIDAQSAALWDTGLNKGMLKMFSAYYKTRQQVQAVYKDPTPEKAATAMIEFVDYLFQGHVRALNALRVRYCTLLRAALVGDGIASADAIAQHSRHCFRQALFEIADVLVDDFWVKMCDNIILYACSSAYAVFLNEVWPDMKELFDPIKSVLPEPVAKAAVHELLIKKIIEVVINKAMTFITTKVLIWAEGKMFTQAAAAAVAAPAAAE
jgi:hypothetical protein